MAAHYIRGDFAVTVALLELVLPTLVLLHFGTRRIPTALVSSPSTGTPDA
jgi:hypothetical protein